MGWRLACLLPAGRSRAVSGPIGPSTGQSSVAPGKIRDCLEECHFEVRHFRFADPALAAVVLTDTVATAETANSRSANSRCTIAVHVKNDPKCRCP